VGVDLVVIIGHTLDATGVFELPARLKHSLPVRAVASESAPFRPAWKPPYSPRDLDIVSPASVTDAWALNRPPTLDGVGDVGSWRVGPRALVGYHNLRYGAFIDERNGHQVPVRRLCRAIAAELGGARAIYVPDSCYQLEGAGDMGVRGSSFDEIEDWLRAIQPPSPTIGAIYRVTVSRFDMDGYFVDDFADLDEPAPPHPTRQRAWDVHEVAEVTSTMARLTGEMDGPHHEWRDVQELATWLAALGRYERAVLTALLNRNGPTPVPQRFRAVIAILDGAEAERVAALRALPDPVPLLVELIETLIPGERSGSTEPAATYAAAILALAELDTDEAARALVLSFRRWGEHGTDLRAVVERALRRCGARILEPALAVWDETRGTDRETLVRALLDSKLRDPRLRAKLQTWLGGDRYPYEELRVVAAYGDDAVIPQIHSIIDDHLASYPASGDLHVVDAATVALLALGGTLGEAQRSRLAAIASELALHVELISDGRRHAKLATARETLARVEPRRAGPRE
jgi:hypothetical protein